MKVFKDHQYLVFDFENGKNVKYDFATKVAYGISGKPVKDLKSQLRGYTVYEMIKDCTDPAYGKFLKYIQNREGHIYNIGTILERVPFYSNMEQFFAAGVENFNSYITCRFSDVPKGLIKLSREHNITLSDEIIRNYKLNPDSFNIAFQLDYLTLTENNVKDILTRWPYDLVPGIPHSVTRFNSLVLDYGYNPKALLLYVDRLATFEALSDVEYALREIKDYARMMRQISPKFDKYPAHFLTTHRIAARNYDRLQQKFDEDQFSDHIKPEMECSFGDYLFIYPKSPQDIKDEAVQQNNCVASYIKSVIDGRCDILFLRHKRDPDKSLVTIEVRDGKIVQALRRFNYAISPDEREAVKKWNERWAKIQKRGLRQIA